MIFQLRDDIARQYVLRKKGGRGPTRMEDSVDVTIYELEEYIKKNKEK